MTEVQEDRRQRSATVGELMRRWREQRGYSQLALANRADISARHLSFLETGRSRPSRDMVLRLGRHLDLALREQNQLLLAAGYAPAFTDSSLDAVEMSPVRDALRQILAGHEPFPALVVDRNWNIVASNSGFALFAKGASPELLRPPVNALRLAVHPDGMQPRIANFPEWRAQLMMRLQRRVELTAEPGLAELHRELSGYPGGAEPAGPRADRMDPAADLTVPLRLRYQDADLSLICTIATFGMPLDVTVAELAVEAFLPADPATAAVLTKLHTAATS
ncbi:helix-turn-helix domain-containing protein [Actinacidiphila guanduensis]|uniref:DNA-binding transcriptional regulator, XRE-family HTH domain n=1 Tax=Actinacidiphila guanduensis TaxID=310781 RepID=A0A1H0J149_9ACTN|nr:helix-turn-helix transcriptional regulator [Actinacidiphila guanduensis]SDO37200.1 DNA-binding transcriptional regulator, XRE-family HTH domain [Actinacidiphila guanduensis]